MNPPVYIYWYESLGRFTKSLRWSTTGVYSCFKNKYCSSQISNCIGSICSCQTVPAGMLWVIGAKVVPPKASLSQWLSVAGILRNACSWETRVLLMCDLAQGLPVSLEKTFWDLQCSVSIFYLSSLLFKPYPTVQRPSAASASAHSTFSVDIFSNKSPSLFILSWLLPPGGTQHSTSTDIILPPHIKMLKCIY